MRCDQEDRTVSNEYSETRAFRGAAFRQADLTGARFRDCDLSGVRIASSQVDDLRITGFDGRAGKVVVDDVDVTAFVNAELDRRYPERVQLRSIVTADDYRAMWTLLARLWSETIGHAQQLPESLRQERVDDEWSFVETLRHLIFAVDVWAGRMFLDEQKPFHPLGLPPTDCPGAEAAALGIDMAATPSFDEIVAEYSKRVARVDALVAAVTDDQLGQIRTAVLTPVWGEESYPVAECLEVIVNEHCEHRRFAVRDLAALEGR
jgi:hypothetical protein